MHTPSFCLTGDQYNLQVTALFADWIQICELPGENESAYSHYVLQLNQQGLLKEDDLTDRFFRLLTVVVFLVFLVSQD